MSTTLFEARKPSSGSPRTGANGPVVPSRRCRSFPPVTTSVGQARRFVAAQLPDCRSEANDAVVLMVSELATNAIEHAQTEFEVEVALDADATAVWVGVRDASDSFPAPRQVVVDAPRGRGLQMVQTLSRSWGIEVERGRPGKTVWFRAGVSGSNPSESRTRGDHSAAVLPPWAARGVRSVLDSLRVGVVATDPRGIVRYVNAAAEELFGWPAVSLVGRSVLDLVPESMRENARDGFATFFGAQGEDIAGQKITATVTRADGCQVDTEAVLSVFDDPAAGRIVVGLFRAQDDQRMEHWSSFERRLRASPAGHPNWPQTVPSPP